MKNNVKNVKTCARKRMKISVGKLVDCAAKANGIMSSLALLAGIDRRTAEKYLEWVPEARAAFESGRESVLDFCESELLKIIRGTPDPNHPGRTIEHSRKFEAIQFALSTLGKKRGYTPKIEQEISGDLKPPELNIIIEK